MKKVLLVTHKVKRNPKSMENQENKQPEEQKSEEVPKQKSVFTSTMPPQQSRVNLFLSFPYLYPNNALHKPTFNPLAEPFEPSRLLINIGSSQVTMIIKINFFFLLNS